MSSTILLADDSLTIQKVVELTFSDTDHEVVAVSSGEDLLQRLPDIRPDLVICDVLMPGTDGYEVCQRIKSDPKFLHIPVVLLTGTFEPFDRDRALAAGCSEIITKPFEARKLVETVERLLAGGPAAPAAVVTEPSAPPMQPGQLEPPPPPGDVGYETRLSPSDGPATFAAAADEDEALEFTSSGFAEMEAAAEADDGVPAAPPDEGLEFEIGEPDVPLPVESTDGAAADDPFADGGDAADLPSAPLAGSADEPFAEPAEATTAPIETPEEPYDEAFGEAGGEPFDSEGPAETWDDGAFDDESLGEVPASPPEAFESGPDEIGAPHEEPAEDAAAGGPPSLEDAEAEPPAARFASPVFPAPPAPAPPSASAEEPDAPPFEEPEPPPADADEADTAPVVEAPAPAAALSDEDVDRIARRVVELAAERIEQIAWEVVPDMAEIVVRERIRQLEAEADGGDSSAG